VACYAAYVTVVTAAGDLGALSEAKTMGAQRLLGLVQTTGFHGPGGGSLSGRLTAEIGYFGTTYVLLALAAPAAALVLRRGGPGPRILGFLYVAAAMALGYALVLGTLEEQELYLLVVPSLMIIPVAATLPRERRGREGRVREGRGREGRVRPATTAIIGALALGLAIGLNVATCLQWRQRPDDGYARLIGYMAAHVPAHATVTAVDGTAEAGITQYALAGRYGVGRWVTPAARSAEHVRYVVVPWAELSEGYSYLTPPEVRYLVRHGRLVFSFWGRTYGHLGLYRVPLPASVR
jgi:hypothetical protein